MQIINKYSRGIRYLLCAIDLFSKYALVVPSKNKKGVTITNAFQSILDKSKRNQMKSGLIKEVNFTIMLLKNGSKAMT